MLKGKELLDYTINQIDPKDKFAAIYTLAEELVELGDDIARRAISLLNPLMQYSFLESIILEDKECDSKIIEYFKSMEYPLPVRYGWKEIRIKSDGTETVVDEVEWYSDKHDCYIGMFKAAVQDIKNCIDCCIGETVKIVNSEDKITIETCGSKDVYELYEI